MWCVRRRYCVTKQYAHEAGQRSLLFQIEYPEIEDGKAPRHRFMSSIEQKIEPWDKRYQYLLFAADPYEVSITVPQRIRSKARQLLSSVLRPCSSAERMQWCSDGVEDQRSEGALRGQERGSFR